MLEAIYTSYPLWKLRNENLPTDVIKTFPWIHTLLAAKWRFGIHNETIDNDLLWWLFESLDKYVARTIPACDVFIGISASGLYTGAQSKHRGIKYICDRGSSHIKYQDNILREEYQRWGLRFSGIDLRVINKEMNEYELADCITVPSEFARISFIEMGVDPKKVKKIPYGADLKMFTPVGSPPKDIFEVLFVGQVSLRKGIPYLLSAFSNLKHSQKRLRIVGSVLPGMDDIFKNYNMDNVEILGPLPQSRLKHIMSTSHVMVLPSIEEGLALVQGQAMACGCPLISTVNTGAEDLFTNEKEGFIVPIRNPDVIAEKLEYLAQDCGQREKMSHAALARVKAINGWDTYGEKYVQLLSDITSGSN